MCLEISLQFCLPIVSSVDRTWQSCSFDKSLNQNSYSSGGHLLFSPLAVMFSLAQAPRDSHVREKDNSCLCEGMLVITLYETEERNLFLVNGL